MATASPPTVEDLTGLGEERARAEAREVIAMSDYRDAEIVRTEQIRAADAATGGTSRSPDGDRRVDRVERGQVQLRLSAAEPERPRARVWAAFRQGLIDLSRVRDIASTIDILERPESMERLDRRVVAYATSHTGAELRVWLRRFVQRVEYDLAIERAEAARADRHVTTRYGDDGMSGRASPSCPHRGASLRSHAPRRPQTHTRGQPHHQPT